jgi:geranylgeranyl pyrophosphate synthase
MKRDDLDSIQSTVEQRLAGWRQRVEQELERWLPSPEVEPRRLHAAQRYCVFGGGKRIRPAIVYATAAMLGVPEQLVDAPACAVELVHTFSLIHDDLPAMDDDDTRRGRQTCHRAFDEATAILAGDALQVLAFQLLAAHASLPADPAVRVRLIELLARANGTAGMAGGQALDLAAVGRELTLEQIEHIYELKTGALLRASMLMAAACAPGLTEHEAGLLDRFGRLMGIAFQIQDDILNVEGDPKLTGKTVGSDMARRKPTYPAMAGLPAAHARVKALHASAREALAEAGWEASMLAALSEWLMARRR